MADGEPSREDVVITKRRVHKAVRNLVMNELGFTKEAIQAIIQSQVDNLVNGNSGHNEMILQMIIRAHNSMSYRRTGGRTKNLTTWLTNTVAAAAAAVSKSLQDQVAAEMKKQIKELLEERLDLSIHIRSQPREKKPEPTRHSRNTEV